MRSRRDHKLATEALDILASLWHIPILVIAIASIVTMIDGRGTEGDVLQPSLVSALLLVLTLFLSALLFHLTRGRNTRAQRRTPHLMRLLRFASTLLILHDMARLSSASNWNCGAARSRGSSSTVR